MVKCTSICIAALAAASLGWAGLPAPQPPIAISCRHAEGAAQQDQVRRAGAATLARAINAAEARIAQRTGQYQPLRRLGPLPAVPAGFELSLYADGSGYIFALKDTLDPCRFTVFSDERGLLYEQSALDAPVIAH